MIFRKLYLKSDLEVEEVLDRLKSVTQKHNSYSTKKYKFEGEILATTFQISPTFELGSDTQLRAKINGRIEKAGIYSIIYLEFKLSKLRGYIFSFAMIFNLLFIGYLFFKPINQFIIWQNYSLALIFTTVLFILYLKSGIDESIKVLSGILRAQKMK